MVPVTRILCPTDSSEFAAGALEQAIALGRRYDAEIVCVHFVPTLMPPEGGLPFVLPPEYEAQVRQAALAELDRFAEPARAAGVPTRVELLEGCGSVAGSIVELAQSLPADLVVMGTHGTGGFERLMLGSVTERVLRLATCPVLTVPRRAHEAGLTPHAGFKSILCPLDFGDSADRALRFAVSLAQQSPARLLLLHVLEGSAEGGVRDLSHWTVPEYQVLLQKEAKERLRAVLGPEERERFTVEDVVASGKPYVEILRLADNRACDLIVMGTHSGALAATLFGSTAQHVVRAAACPVITVRS